MVLSITQRAPFGAECQFSRDQPSSADPQTRSPNAYRSRTYNVGMRVMAIPSAGLAS